MIVDMRLSGRGIVVRLVRLVDDRPFAIGIVVKVGLSGSVTSDDSVSVEVVTTVELRETEPGSVTNVDRFDADGKLRELLELIVPGRVTTGDCTVVSELFEDFGAGNVTIVGRDETDARDRAVEVPTVIEVEVNEVAVTEDFASGKVTAVTNEDDDVIAEDVLEAFGSGKVTTVGGGDCRVDGKLDDVKAGVANVGDV
jgi:hypothetical protein